MTGLRHTGGPLGQPEECGSTTGGALLEEILRPKSILQKLDNRAAFDQEVQPGRRSFHLLEEPVERLLGLDSFHLLEEPVERLLGLDS